jgi:non-specific serine/threonine protein kinase
LLTPQQIAARLDDRFRLLTSGNRAAVARHRTLQALIEWDYTLLSEREQEVFCRLAVFAGGWTLDEAEAVVAGDGIAADEVLDLLARLVDKSLVVADVGPNDSARYRLLETLRQYARARLADRDEGTVRDRHARYFLDLAEQVEPRLESDDLPIWLDQLQQEHNNLRASLHWLRTSGDVALGLRLATALRLFWHLRGHLTEGREWLESWLTLDPGVPAELRARALDASGFLARFQGHYAAAEPLIRESLALRRELGDRQAVADALNNLGSILLAQGAYTSAQALYEEGLATYRETENRQGIADSLSHLGLIAFHERRLAAAQAAHAESLMLWRELGDHQGVGWALYRLGDVSLAEGNLGEARRYFTESLEARCDLGDQWGIAESLDGFAMLAAAEQQPERALRLAGAAAALYAGAGLIVAPIRRAQTEARLEPARRALGPAAGEAWEAGRSLPLADAVAAALAGNAPVTGVDAPAGTTADVRSGATRLTPREAEVAECLARAMSNREIADALSISERTVERHVENILTKLDLHSRTHVAVWVTRQVPDANRPG